MLTGMTMPMSSGHVVFVVVDRRSAASERTCSAGRQFHVTSASKHSTCSAGRQLDVALGSSLALQLVEESETTAERCRRRAATADQLVRVIRGRHQRQAAGTYAAAGRRLCRRAAVRHFTQGQST